jgi:hypothetical protein
MKGYGEEDTCPSCGEKRVVSGGPRNPMFRIGESSFTQESAGDSDPSCGNCKEWKDRVVAEYPKEF